MERETRHLAAVAPLPLAVHHKCVVEDNAQDFFPTCWESTCSDPITIRLHHFGCNSPHCGIHPDHPLHPVGSDYWCNDHGEQRIAEWRRYCLVEDNRAKADCT